MRYSCVLFDLDGTLVDSIELIVRAAEFAFAACEMSVPSRATIMAGIGRPLLEQFEQHATSAGQVNALFGAYRQYQLAHHDELTSAYDGIVDEVQWIRTSGGRTGVVTSKIEPLAHRALHHVGLAPHFDVVVGIESTTRHKPNADPLVFAMDRLQADRADSVYVGDSPFDIQAAHAAGITAIAVTWGAFSAAALRDEAPHHLVTHPRELRPLLSG